MNVTFYNFSKRRNSTKLPTGSSVSYNCLLKEDTTTSRPQIMIKWDGQSGAPAQYNYCYIPAFGRYYWVNSWAYSDRQWVASCSVDVLATYKQQIGSSNKYVLRAYSDFDPYAPDNKYPLLEPPLIQAFACSGIAWATQFDGGRFVVGVVGAGNTFNAAGVGYYVIDSTGLQGLINACFTKSMQVWTSTTTLGNNIGEALNKYGENLEKSLANPIQFINSICWVPFIPVTGGQQTIKLGNIDTGVGGYTLASPIHLDTFTASVNQWNSGRYAWPNLEPYCRFTLHFPPFPDIEVPAELLLPNPLSLQGVGSVQGSIYTDVTNGMAVMSINKSGNAGLLSASAQVGVMINLAGSSVDYAGQIKAAAATAGSAISAFFNPAGAIGGVTSGIIGFAEASQPKARSGGYSGGMGAIKASEDRAIIQYLYPIPELAEEEVGIPLLKYKTISSLSGFVMCAEGEVDCNATEDEHRELEDFLTGGFFYE